MIAGLTCFASGNTLKFDEIMCWLLCAIVDHERIVSIITALGVRWTGLPHSPKTNGDHLVNDKLGRYCSKTNRQRESKKVVPLEIKPRASGTLPLDSLCCDYAHHLSWSTLKISLPYNLTVMHSHSPYSPWLQHREGMNNKLYSWRNRQWQLVHNIVTALQAAPVGSSILIWFPDPTALAPEGSENETTSIYGHSAEISNTVYLRWLLHTMHTNINTITTNFYGTAFLKLIYTCGSLMPEGEGGGSSHWRFVLWFNFLIIKA